MKGQTGLPSCAIMSNPRLEDRNLTTFSDLPGRKRFSLAWEKNIFSAWEDRKPGWIATLESIRFCMQQVVPAFGLLLSTLLCPLLTD